MKRSSGRVLVLWGRSEKELPPKPGNPESLNKEDRDYWYDKEYAGWDAAKINIPVSPSDGAAGKYVIYIQPGPHHYMDEYAGNLKKKAAAAGIRLDILESYWDDNQFDRNVSRAIAEKPDLILLNPENQGKSNFWYRKINEAGIPVIGGNFLPDNEGFSYLLAWTGPDDWGQIRLLARDLAERMNCRGNYAILQHREGTSSYFARTWGFISEMKSRAPGMNCLDCRSPGMDRKKACSTVMDWIARYGRDLQAILSSDDEQVLLGVVDALKETGREDILTVAPGSSRTGLELLKQGKVEALTYQSAAVDGSIAMETIIDWFEGVPVEPIRYLPQYIIHREEASDFLNAIESVEAVNLETLYRGIESCDWEGVYGFFGDAYQIFLKKMIIPTEMFQAFCLEILTNLILILNGKGLEVEETIGSYERMIKHLLLDEDIGSVLEWLNGLSQSVIRQIMISRNQKTPIQQIIDYVEEHYCEPLSLKTLARDFMVSPVYLGQLFRKETGEKFNDYLNRKRVEEACFRLGGDNARASSIALDLGFSDPAYFYKIFKKYTGKSVSEFVREQL